MPVESDEDRASFFDEDEYATRVVTDGGSFSANYDDAFVAAVFSDGARMDSSAPQITCATCDVVRTNLRQGTGLELEVKGVMKRFLVREHQPDGSGVSALILDEAP